MIHILFISILGISTAFGVTIAKTNPTPVIKKGRTNTGFLDINKPFTH